MMTDLPQAYHMLNRAMASNSGGGTISMGKIEWWDGEM